MAGCRCASCSAGLHFTDADEIVSLGGRGRVNGERENGEEECRSLESGGGDGGHGQRDMCVIRFRDDGGRFLGRQSTRGMPLVQSMSLVWGGQHGRTAAQRPITALVRRGTGRYCQQPTCHSRLFKHHSSSVETHIAAWLEANPQLPSPYRLSLAERPCQAPRPSTTHAVTATATATASRGGQGAGERGQGHTKWKTGRRQPAHRVPCWLSMPVCCPAMGRGGQIKHSSSPSVLA